MAKFALLIALALACGEAGALKCFYCHNSILTPNLDCEKSPPDSKYVKECPASPTGKAARCSQLDGLITTDRAANIDDFERSCVNFPTSNAPENKCYTDTEAENWILRSIDHSTRPSFIGSFSFKGTACFCDTDQCNSVASLQPFLGLLVAAVGMYVMGVRR